MRIAIETAPAIDRLEAMRERLSAGLALAVADESARLVSLVEANLSGEVLEARSGRLRDSIRAEKAADGSAARVFCAGPVPYARIQEYGGRIAVPEEIPEQAKALAFVYGGRLVFARRTAAHFVNIPERSYLRSALTEFAGGFVASVRKLAADCLA